MARTEDIPEPLRTNLTKILCSTFGTTPFNAGPPLRQRKIAIISSAALVRRGQQPFHFGSSEARVVLAAWPATDILMTHVSIGYDRSGFQRDINTIYPIDRLRELAAEGAIRAVADTNYTVLGSTDPMLDRTATANSADRIAGQLNQEGVDSVLLCPVCPACTRAVSALGHLLEERGFSTVALGLVRSQMEQVKPPRGLWTPFEMGRPLGEPEDAAFQRRVLMQALGLLERIDGPVILDDFPDDAPNWSDTPGWKPPLHAANPLDADSHAAATQFAAELQQLRPAWDAARNRYGRTTVGLSFLEVTEWPVFVAAVLRGEFPIALGHATSALSIRFLADDIKAMYSESAQAKAAPPSSRQIDSWFWRSTIAGSLLRALRNVATASSNNALKTVGGRFLVPLPFVPVL